MKRSRYTWFALALVAVWAGSTARTRAAEVVANSEPAGEPPTEWIDADTGHRIVRLSREPNSESLYFNVPAFTPDGKKMVFTSPTGLYTIELASRKIEQVVEGRMRILQVGFKTPTVYYSRSNAVFATDLATKTTRQITQLPRGGRAVTVNADETLIAGTITEMPADTAGTNSVDGFANPNSDSMFKSKARNIEERFSRKLPMELFFLNLQTGDIKTYNRCTDWLNHLQFSPTDPGLLMFCHEGPWHKLDRIWTIRSDGSEKTLVHKRTFAMEIAGHEFWSADGKTIWYDLQTPRGEDFWVGGYNVETGERIHYHLLRDEWSVHFNVSPDGKLFLGDGGSSGMVAHAPDGQWIYLFRPEMIPVTGSAETDSPNLIQPGVFRSERLVNMSKHDYQLEPNAMFTPDMKWIVFRSNMHGSSYVYAVEVRKAR